MTEEKVEEKAEEKKSGGKKEKKVRKPRHTCACGSTRFKTVKKVSGVLYKAACRACGVEVKVREMEEPKKQPEAKKDEPQEQPKVEEQAAEAKE